MFEYMASKKPIIASNMPSIREILSSENAVLAVPGEASSFVQGITSVINNTELADAITTRAFSDVQNYTWEKRAQKILYFLNK